MSIDKQYLREVAKQATGAHERINAISADDIFDISLHQMFRSEGADK
ncbi:ead/Ea22-like family protein [Klebsiella pneumoniae]